MSFWSDFKYSSQKEWEDKTMIDLKSNSLDELIWKSEIGEINPIIFNSEHVNESIPINTTLINGYFDLKKATNNKILTALSQGINSITLYNGGYSPKILKQVTHEIIDNNILFNGSNISSFFENWMNWYRSFNKDSLSGSFRFDPIEHLAIKGNWLHSENDDSKQWIEFFRSCQTTTLQCIYVDGSIYANAIANADEQIAYISAHMNEYFELLRKIEQKSNLPIKVIVKTAIGTSYFMEIAKVRALRNVISSIAKYHKLNIILQVEGTTSKTCLSPVDIDSNLLRMTSGTMAAIIGGCDILSVFTNDHQLSCKNKNSNRLATNIAHILQKEAHLDKVSDPAKGAYIIEEMTSLLKNRSWDLFKDIEDKGGWISYLKTNEAQNKCYLNAKNLKNEIKDGSKVIVGLNKYKNLNEDHAEPIIEINKLNELAFHEFNINELI